MHYKALRCEFCAVRCVLYREETRLCAMRCTWKIIGYVL